MPRPKIRYKTDYRKYCAKKRLSATGFQLMPATTPLEQTLSLRISAEANRRMIRVWLYFICLLVAAMVIVGGATRLTDSGLSITEWKPLLGAIPPLNQQDWLEAFHKYKLIPEFQQINSDMTLAGFKLIYWWEWAHRFLGRFVGIAFFVPMVFFWGAGKLESWLKPRLVLLFILGGLQGAIGWWMVKSGLVERVDVSQYRLAVHLTLACLIFAYGFWVARGLAPHSAKPSTSGLRAQAGLISLLVLVQIFIGGLVAGLDAGLAFNTWPKMDGVWIPGDLWIMRPHWINLFENLKTVQFIHRLGAYLVFVLAAFHAFSSLRGDVQFPHQTRAVLLFLLVSSQAALGIMALLLLVPFNWAIAHQFGAIIVLGFAMAHWRGLKGPYPAMVEIRREVQFGR